MIPAALTLRDSRGGEMLLEWAGPGEAKEEVFSPTTGR